jgi:hypothetical protein
MEMSFSDLTLEKNIEFNYSISNVQLDKKSESRDLGVILDSTLSFIPHTYHLHL